MKNESLIWLNEPDSWQADATGLVAMSKPQTDFWRLTHDGGLRDSGHFYHQQVAGNFSAQVHLEGQYEAQFDQAGLMLRVDESRWIKCGIEYVDGRYLASAVVTQATSDWSTAPVDNGDRIDLTLKRTGDLIEISYRTVTGDSPILLRQTTFVAPESVALGLMLASPSGPGFRATFTDFTIGTISS